MSSARRKRPVIPSIPVEPVVEPVEEPEAQESPPEAEAEAPPEAEAEPQPEAQEPPPEAEPKKATRERDVHIAIMDETFVLIDTIYRSRHTLLDILSTRGYDVERYRKFSPAEAAEASGGTSFTGLSFTATKPDDPHAACQVYYGSVTPQKLESFLEEHVTDDVSEHTEVIFMQTGAVTERHHQMALRQFFHHKKDGTARKVRVSYFCIDNLVINPLNHVLVPKHEIVPESEHKALLAALYVTSKAKLPEIKFHVDPIARCIGAKPGDIVKITRPSASAGEAIIYRICSR